MAFSHCIISKEIQPMSGRLQDNKEKKYFDLLNAFPGHPPKKERKHLFFFLVRVRKHLTVHIIESESIVVPLLSKGYLNTVFLQKCKENIYVFLQKCKEKEILSPFRKNKVFEI